jgi:hypothetical protein
MSGGIVRLPSTSKRRSAKGGFRLAVDLATRARVRFHNGTRSYVRGRNRRNVRAAALRHGPQSGGDVGRDVCAKNRLEQSSAHCTPVASPTRDHSSSQGPRRPSAADHRDSSAVVPPMTFCPDAALQCSANSARPLA